jgi:predicted NUDIX family NTP pyrophosphohydrolase
MAKVSAGLLMYRRRGSMPEVLLAHPGGPFWAKKDLGAWSIPKGEVTPDEDLPAAAKREFEEELGLSLPGNAELISLGHVTQKAGKVVHVWAFEGDCDPSAAKGNTFAIVWPPRSGKMQEFLEVDRAEFFGFQVARKKLNPAQVEFLDRLATVLAKTDRASE